MKSIFTLLLTIGLISNGIAQIDVGSLYFDGDTIDNIQINYAPDSGNIWQIGPPAKTLFDRASTLPNAIITDTINNYPDSVRHSFTLMFKPVIWTSIYSIQWQQKIDLDTTGDIGIVEYFDARQSTWKNIFENSSDIYRIYSNINVNSYLDTLSTGEIGFSGTYTNDWQQVWVCFDAYQLSNNLQDSLRFRFTIISDSIPSLNEGWIMDNFFISPTLVHTAGNLKSSSYLRVYPNPVSRILQLKLAPESGLYKIDQISLFNSTGQKILERFNLDLENNISLEPYEPGVYQLDVITNGKKEHFSFIISPH